MKANATHERSNALTSLYPCENDLAPSKRPSAANVKPIIVGSSVNPATDRRDNDGARSDNDGTWRDNDSPWGDNDGTCGNAARPVHACCADDGARFRCCQGYEAAY
jgi:hypothetical protein